jgi:predicted PurR-regulated permease PerM
MTPSEQTNMARWLAMLTLTGIGLYLCWIMLKPFVGVLEWAVVLVIVYHPIHKQLVKRTRRPSLSALLSCLLVIVVVVVPLLILTMAIARELSQVIPNLPANFSQLMSPQSLLGKITSWLNMRFGIDPVSAQKVLLDQLRVPGEILLESSWSLVSNIAGLIVKSFFVLFTMYYLFKDSDRILMGLREVLPVSSEQCQKMIERIGEVVSASVYGVVTIACLQGLLGGLAFWVLGIPSPLLWAVLMTFVCMIPIAGSFLVWLPLSLYLMASGHWTSGVVLVIWGTLAISLVDNFLRPKLIRNQTKLHELFVFFSVLGGIGVFGLLGIVLGPVVLATTLGLIQTFRPHSATVTE